MDRNCDQFEADWKGGKTPRIEDYLARVAPSQRERLVQELLALEIEYRLRRGERPSLADYQPRFAEYAEAVKAAFTPRGAQAAPASVWPATQPPGPVIAPTLVEPQATLTVLEGPSQGRGLHVLQPRDVRCRAIGQGAAPVRGRRLPRSCATIS